MTRKLFQRIATRVDARAICAKANNAEWFSRHEDAAIALTKHFMPSGSGVDCGTAIDLDKSTGERLIFTTSFHHMDDAGGYDGWTNHSVFVIPSLQFGFLLRITGRDRNGIKEYLHELFSHALDQDIPDDCTAEVA